MTTASTDLTAPTSRVAHRVLVFLFLLAAVATSAGLRIHGALGDPNFDAQDPRPLLRSDPGLLYYITERIVAAGGGIPDDFHADTHIEYPAQSNIPEMFSVGQEFLVAWMKLWFGANTPLHIVALWTMAIFSSLSLLGVFGLAREVTRSSGWAALATLIALVLLGNYRTIGFILIREDFAMPFFALQLYALARAARLRTRGSIALLALLFVAAAATWHAMGFILTIEAGVLVAWFLRSGENPMGVRGAWVFALFAGLGSVLIPMLRAKGFLFSIPMLAMASLALGAWIEGRSCATTRLVRCSVPAALVVFMLLAAPLSRLLFGSAGDYSHVFELVMAKARYLGERPLNPKLLSFDARLLWQGPFNTPSWTYFSAGLGVGLLGLGYGALWAARGWWRASGDRSQLLLAALGVGGVLAAVLVQRTIILPTLIAPVIGVMGLQKIRHVALRGTLVIAGLGLQVALFQGWYRSYQCPWYEPAQRNKELAEVLRWIEKSVSSSRPIAADYVTGTAVLASAGNPMLVQPKYETTSSRRRLETFMTTFGSGSLAEYEALLKANKCRFVLSNFNFWSHRFYELGFTPSPTWRPPVDSPFYWFCHFDPNVYRNIPGFELVYQSQDRFGKDYFRVYRRRATRQP